VHGAGNYPFRKEQSDLDIALPDGAGDDAYLGAVRAGLAASERHDPELVYYVAGADAFEGDRLGRSASDEGCARAARPDGHGRLCRAAPPLRW
jgi:acetoin utilization deacetylase AcuC-like enzyme